MSVVRRHDPSTVHAPGGRYSHVSVHPLGDGLKRVVISGQVGMRPDGSMAEGLEAQADQAWANLVACLASEDLAVDDLVKVTILCPVPGRDSLLAIRDARARALGDLAPSSTYVTVAGLASDAYLVEIEAEAVGPA
jgi:enamine deaminase RidA (YjgF/YER057c/UK114 family)